MKPILIIAALVLALFATTGCSSSSDSGDVVVVNGPGVNHVTVVYGGRAVADVTVTFSNPGYSSNVYLEVKNISGQKYDLGFQLTIHSSNGHNFNFTTSEDIVSLANGATYTFGQINSSPVQTTNPTFSVINVSVAYIYPG